MPYSREEVGHTDEPEKLAVVEPLPEPTFEELLAEVQRATHNGVFNPVLTKREFQNTQFVCWLNDLKQNRKGDVIISLMIPYRYRAFAYPLADAQGIPLSIDVQRWQKFNEYREALTRDAENG